MQRFIRAFLSKLFIIAISLCFVAPVFCAETNLPAGDIGDYGSWTTEVNQKHFVNTISTDIEQFQGEFQKKVVSDYVPVEAKIGVAFMNGLSFIARVLDSSLVRFGIVFMIISYIFWAMLEAYTIIVGKNDAKKHTFGIIKKGLYVFIWIAILNVGPAQAFMMLMSPIMQAATYVSDGILNVVSSVAGISLPDTCGAIREYAAANISDNSILSASYAADIMCVPTRLSGFCYSAVAIGWKWMLLGIGRSAFSFLCGGAFVCGFIYVAWRFAFIAFGVIADLFMSVMFLPFTALSETIGTASYKDKDGGVLSGTTTYKGLIGDIFNGFMGLFKVGSFSLSDQVGRFINAALHFIVLAVVIALSAGLLSEVVELNSADAIPHIEDAGFFITILVLALCVYLAKHANSIATEFGGDITTKLGNSLQSDVSNLWAKTKKGARGLRDIIRDRKK